MFPNLLYKILKPRRLVKQIIVQNREAKYRNQAKHAKKVKLKWRTVPRSKYPRS